MIDLCSFFPAHQAHDAFEGVRPRPTKPPGFPVLKEWHRSFPAYMKSFLEQIMRSFFDNDSRAKTAEFVHVCFVQSRSEE